MITKKEVKKMQFLMTNAETIITIISMGVTWILGYFAKKSPYINNNLIIIQNIIVGILASFFYYLITKDISTAITLSGLFAETGYNLFHNIEKLFQEANIQKNLNNNS